MTLLLLIFSYLALYAALCLTYSFTDSDEDAALERIKAYWKWFKQETEKNAGLGGLLKDYIKQEETNAKNGGRPLQIHTHELRNRVDDWVVQGWLFEKPKSAQVKEMMLDLGMRLQQGIWRKN